MFVYCEYSLFSLQRITSLEVISMPQNGINAVGIAALAEAFAVCKKLKLVNLNDNTVTCTGAKALAEVRDT